MRRNIEPTERMLKARQLRMHGHSLEAIGKLLRKEKPITRQGVRFILLKCDEFFLEEHRIGTKVKLGNYLRKINARKQSTQPLQEEKS